MTKKGPFHHVLIALDPAGLAFDAAVRGLSLAERLGARADVLQVVPGPPSTWDVVAHEEFDDRPLPGSEGRVEPLEAARRALRETVGRARESAGVAAEAAGGEALVVEGHAAEAILATAERVRADLVVLGPHAEHSLFDFGSTTRAVLSHADVPVWVQVGPVAPVRRILVPVDFSDHSASALELAHELADGLGATLHLLHAYSPPAFAYAESVEMPTYVVDHERKAAGEELERWRERLVAQRDVPVESEVVEGSVHATILDAAERADLTVMGTHGRTGLSRFLLGSVTYGVLKELRKPALVTRSADATWVRDHTEPPPPDAPLRAAR